MRALFALLIFIASASTILGADLHLNFLKYPAKIIYIGRDAPMIQNENITIDSEYFFRNTSYSQMSTQSWREFGGHFRLYTAGCGSPCETGIIVERMTGMVMNTLPFPEAVSGYDFRAYSRLLVVNPTNKEILANVEGFPISERFTRYYEWTGQDWKFIASEPWPKVLTEAEKIQASLFGDNGPSKKTFVEPETFLDLRERDIPIPLSRPTKLSELFDSLR